MKLQEALAPYKWECQKGAEELVIRVIQNACEKNSFLHGLAKELIEGTSSPIFHWVDHIEIGYTKKLDSELEECGFISEIATPTYRVFHHPGAKLPLIVVRDEKHPFIGIALLVDRIEDFLMVRGLSHWVEGSPFSSFARCLVSKEGGVSVWAVERRGVLTMEPITLPPEEIQKVLLCYEKWKTRPRNQENDEQEQEGFLHAMSLAEELVETVGQGMAASIVLDVERQYWQAKNKAGQIQKNRQDALGMGWANHDHHTFRSSRRYFRSLVRLFEILGFHCRERFYAGLEAGWGAQVMEHHQARLVLFLDVDLAPEELHIDFAHQPLAELDNLGTIGLWCALHGESILKAGMHHLEAQFSFDQLQKDLGGHGVQMMAPFSNLPYLKQAFTVGETWKVAQSRVQRLLDKGLITNEQAEHFLLRGALGSHLENLERKEGFKGFNQKNIDVIIKETDPRLSNNLGA